MRRLVRGLGVAALTTLGLLGACASAFAGGVVVKGGEAKIILAPANVDGGVTVQAGGALAIEGASVSGPLKSNGATSIHICGAHISGPLEILNSTGPVTIGGPGCAGNTITGPVTITGNGEGVSVEGNSISGPLTVTGNSGEVSVRHNTVHGPSHLQPIPGLALEKLQQIVGSGEGFTTATLRAEAGHTVNYEIVATNTGTVALSLSALGDEGCDANTIAGGPGASPLAAGASTTYTCSHLLNGFDQTNGAFINVASLAGTPTSGPGVAAISNPVEVEVPCPVCTPPACVC
jgi:hypothetical protein